MYVIFPASDVVDESYLALVSQEQGEANPTGLTSTSVRADLLENENRELEHFAPLDEDGSNVTLQPPGPVYHSTWGEQEAAERRIHQGWSRWNKTEMTLTLVEKAKPFRTVASEGSSHQVPTRAHSSLLILFQCSLPLALRFLGPR